MLDVNLHGSLPYHDMQQVTVSGDAEWPKVADAVIEALPSTWGKSRPYAKTGVQRPGAAGAPNSAVYCYVGRWHGSWRRSVTSAGVAIARRSARIVTILSKTRAAWPMPSSW